MKKSGAKQFVIDDALKIYNVLISFHEQENRNSSDRITLRQLRLFSRPRRIILREYLKKKEEKYLSRTRSIFDRFPYVTMRTFLFGSDIRSDPERYRMIHVFPRYRKLGGKFMRRFAFDPSSTRGKRRESGQTVTR